MTRQFPIVFERESSGSPGPGYAQGATQQQADNGEQSAGGILFPEIGKTIQCESC